MQFDYLRKCPACEQEMVAYCDNDPVFGGDWGQRFRQKPVPELRIAQAETKWEQGGSRHIAVIQRLSIVVVDGQMP